MDNGGGSRSKSSRKIRLMCSVLSPNILRPDQTLASLHVAAMDGLDSFFRDVAPDMVLVQSDTSTAMVGAFAAFYLDIPVGHVEAGTSLLVGRQPQRIVEAAERLLRDEAYYRQVATRKNPFGDGRAAARIVDSLAQFGGLTE